MRSYKHLIVGVVGLALSFILAGYVWYSWEPKAKSVKETITEVKTTQTPSHEVEIIQNDKKELRIPKQDVLGTVATVTTLDDKVLAGLVGPETQNEDVLEIVDNSGRGMRIKKDDISSIRSHVIVKGSKSIEGRVSPKSLASTENKTTTTETKEKTEQTPLTPKEQVVLWIVAVAAGGYGIYFVIVLVAWSRYLFSKKKSPPPAFLKDHLDKAVATLVGLVVGFIGGTNLNASPSPTPKPPVTAPGTPPTSPSSAK